MAIERVDADYFNSDLNIDDYENVEIERTGVENFESNTTFIFGITFDNSCSSDKDTSRTLAI